MFNFYIPNDYVRALVILVVYFFILRVVLFVLRKIFMKLAAKTSTDLDDKLAQRSFWPLTIVAFVIILRIAINEIPLSEDIRFVVISAIWSVLVLILAHFVFIFFDVIIIHGLRKLAIKTKSRIDDSLINLFHSVMKISLVIISLLYILELWGVEITPLLAGLGIAGLAIALALQPVLSNIFSGVSMILDHSVRVGDLVYLDADTKGKIEKVGLRSTRITTFDNELIIVPNNKLSESTIQNVALPEPKTRAVVPFGVAYGSDIAKVKKVILKEIRTIKNVVLEDSEPVIRFIEMADSSLNFKAYFFVNHFENRFAAIDEANTKIYNALNKNNIEIPFPQRDVHMKK